MNTVQDALKAAAQRLTGVSDSPALDAQLLLAHVLDKGRSWLYAWPEHQLSDEASGRFDTLIARRAAGTPVAHLVGRREFWSLALRVTPATLIPRPETELLVERTLLRLPPRATVVDLGTGSGAIALAIASERPDCRVLAVERSDEALAVARDNALRLGLSVDFREGSWLEPVRELAEAIVSNPPYIAEDDPHLQRGDVRFEPRAALTAGGNGLDDIRVIVGEARARLANGGWLLVEHGWDQGEAVATLFREAGFETVTTYRDDGGRDRVTEGRWKGS